MADLDRLLYTALTGLSPASEPRDVPGQIRALEAAVGGSRRASEMVGVTQRTWQRWRAGTARPRPGHAGLLKLAQRLIRLTPARAARLARLDEPTAWWVNLYDMQDKRSTARALKWQAGGVGAVIDAWRIGDDTAAVAAFLDHIGDRWYRDMLSIGAGISSSGAPEPDLEAAGVQLQRVAFRGR